LLARGRAVELGLVDELKSVLLEVVEIINETDELTLDVVVGVAEVEPKALLEKVVGSGELFETVEEVFKSFRTPSREKRTRVLPTFAE
jgi:hypothetical protein